MPFIRKVHVLFKTCLMFSRINGPNVSLRRNTDLSLVALFVLRPLRSGIEILRGESLGAENLEAQEHYSRYNNSNFFVYYYGPIHASVSKYLLNGIPTCLP